MPGNLPSSTQTQDLGRLIVAAVLITAIPQLPLGNYAIYPFTILTTWFHEMGHGLMGLVLGHDFERLVILPSGSGYAETSSSSDISAISRALISAGGPLAPTCVGSLLILASSRSRYWRPVLVALAAVIALSVLIWVRSLVGLIVLPLVALALIGIAIKARPWLQRLSLQFLGVLAALSMYRDWDYLFSRSTVIGGRPMLSDTGAIEAVLLLPYWFWATIITLISGLMIGASLKFALAPGNQR